MREINFRGFNKKTKTMIDLLKITPLALDPNLKSTGLYIPFDEDVELMQYTGMHDKNRKELYEGDIVKWWETHIPENPFTYKVIYNGARFLFQGDAVFDVKDIEPVGKYHQYEIIGNIYENSELMETSYK